MDSGRPCASARTASLSLWALVGGLFGLLSGFLIILTLFWGAFGTVLGFFLLSRLPRLYHPVFNVPDFGAASRDGYFLVILADDPAFDPEQTRAWLRDAGAETVEEVQR
jgi:hypothetical protein